MNVLTFGDIVSSYREHQHSDAQGLVRTRCSTDVKKHDIRLALKGLGDWVHAEIEQTLNVPAAVAFSFRQAYDAGVRR